MTSHTESIGPHTKTCSSGNDTHTAGIIRYRERTGGFIVLFLKSMVIKPTVNRGVEEPQPMTHLDVIECVGCQMLRSIRNNRSQRLPLKLCFLYAVIMSLQPMMNSKQWCISKEGVLQLGSVEGMWPFIIENFWGEGSSVLSSSFVPKWNSAIIKEQ